MVPVSTYLISLFWYWVSISDIHASYTRYPTGVLPSMRSRRYNLYASSPQHNSEATNKPFGNRYPPLRLNIAQKICLYSIPTSISTRITYSVRVTHDGFPLGSIWRPERLIILCTRDTRNICPNIIRDVRRPYTSFCFYTTFVRTGLTERKCLTTYWNEAIYPTCSMGSYEYTWLDRIL